jgi:hypothetical protein
MRTGTANSEMRGVILDIPTYYSVRAQGDTGVVGMPPEEALVR